MHTSRCSELWLKNVEESKFATALSKQDVCIVGISNSQTAEIGLVMAGVMRETSWHQSTIIVILLDSAWIPTLFVRLVRGQQADLQLPHCHCTSTSCWRD